MTACSSSKALACVWRLVAVNNSVQYVVAAPCFHHPCGAWFIFRSFTHPYIELSSDKKEKNNNTD